VRQTCQVLLAAFFVLSLGPITTWAGQEEAARRFAEGRALLAQGDFKAALEAFSEAAKGDPENAEYRQEAVVLKRVLSLREQLSTEQENWQQTARALFAYYRSREVWKEAAAVAQLLHDKSPGTESAVLLAEARLAMNQNEEAATLLAGLPADQGTVQTRVLHGLALARAGRLEEARKVAGEIELPKDCPGVVCYYAARLQALLGQADRAVNTLTCAFECTPAGELERLKEQAKACADLAALRTTEGFAKALQTASKVKGGCGGCTAACPSQTSEKKPEGCGERQQPSKETCEHGKS